MALIFFLLLVISSLSSLLLSVEAEPVEPDEVSEGLGMFNATWKFNIKDDFNVTGATIESSEVVLQSYDYIWNQSTEDDFEDDEAIKENVTVFKSSNTTIKWHDYFEAKTSVWEHAPSDGGADQWEYGLISLAPGFIGTLGTGAYVWGTSLSGKYDESGDGRDYYLKSPNIDLRESEQTELSIWHYYDFEDDINFNDGGIIEVSIDNGENWEQIFPKAGYDGTIEDLGNPLYTPLPNPTWCFGGNSSSWTEESFDLSDYDGSENFSVRFRFATNGQGSDWGWYIDDIEITSTTYSDGEVELTATNIDLGSTPNTDIPRVANWTIIDVNNPAESDGILTEWEVYVATGGRGKMKIFREVEDGFILTDETEFEDLEPGRSTFDCYIEIEAGDYIGWYSDTAEIWANSTTGSAFKYNITGDFNDTFPKENWTSVALTLWIKAEGIYRDPVGSLTSSVFDAGSAAIWEKISWDEKLTNSTGHIVGDIVLQTRTGESMDTSHNSWDPWSPQVTNPKGSTITSPNARYIQFLVTLVSTELLYSPTLYNVSISYRKYSPSGEVETRDFIPDVVVQWNKFSTLENLNGQNINYYYSLDSGVTWKPLPDNDNLPSISVLEGKIRLKVVLSTTNTTVSPVLGEMSLTYSSATPDIKLFIEVDKKTAKPGDRISYTIFYHNKGIGNAEGVSITLVLDGNLSYRGDFSGVTPTIEEGNAIRWQLNSVEPGNNKTLIVETKVKDVDKEITLSTYAIVNYTDVGGNRYEGNISNAITINVKISQDLLPYYLSLALIIAIIIIISVFLIVYRLRAMEEDRIALEDVEKGMGYLVMEENPTKSYTLFSELIDEGYTGLCITRTFPQRVRTSYYFEGISILWLSRRGDTDSILPTNLGAVVSNVKDFMKENKDTVILLDGLEYLIVHNDFEKVLKLVHALNELSAINESVLIIPLNFKTLEEGKVALLKRDLKVLG